MGSRSKTFNEWFRVESLVKRLNDLSPDLLRGKYPEAFSRELTTYWQYGDAFVINSRVYVARVGRNDVPEELRGGFGPYYGAVVTPFGILVADSSEKLDEIFEGRLLAARDGTEEFGNGSI